MTYVDYAMVAIPAFVICTLIFIGLYIWESLKRKKEHIKYADLCNKCKGVNGVDQEIAKKKAVYDSLLIDIASAEGKLEEIRSVRMEAQKEVVKESVDEKAKYDEALALAKEEFEKSRAQEIEELKNKITGLEKRQKFPAKKLARAKPRSGASKTKHISNMKMHKNSAGKQGRKGGV